MPNLSKFRTATLTIDGEPVVVRVARLKLEEAEAYKATFRVLLNAGDEALSPEDAAFVRASIETYLSVAPGVLAIDGEPVTTGAQLLDVIGENPGLVLRALLAINGTAGVSEAEGKRSASESVSVPSSDGHDLAPVGQRPATTADAAAPEGSVPIEDARAETDRPSSGQTETSS